MASVRVRIRVRVRVRVEVTLTPGLGIKVCRDLDIGLSVGSYKAIISFQDRIRVATVLHTSHARQQALVRGMSSGPSTVQARFLVLIQAFRIWDSTQDDLVAQGIVPCLTARQ